MEDETVSVYHDDRKVLDTKIINIIITKLLSLCVTTEIFDDRNCQCKFTLYGPFGACFVSIMEDKACSVYPDIRKSLDDVKIDGDILPNFDKKVMSDIELRKFAMEVDNVKRWYMSTEQQRQWPDGCVTKIAKNAFCKRALGYQYQEKSKHFTG